MSIIKKTTIIFIILILVVIIKIFWNTFSVKNKQINVEPIKPLNISDKSISNLSKAIQIKTVSHDDTDSIDYSQFSKFRNFLEKTYPNIHSKMSKEVINQHSLLYCWKGKNTKLKPIILLAHQDVVEAKHLDNWSFPPFSGEINNNYIYGRGTLDNKGSLISIMESCEKLLQNNFQPQRTVYLAFGHDEEIMGMQGAKKIATILEKRKINAHFILDEGLIVTDGIVPNIKKTVALIGTCEKGFASFKLETEAEGGHSSMPEKKDAISQLSEAIFRLKKNGFSPKITKPVDGFLDYLTNEMPFTNKMAFSNRWLFERLIISQYKKTNSGNALIKTTIAPTIFNSGNKENVMPQSAYAIINIRILPETSISFIEKHIRKTIDNPKVKISRMPKMKEVPPVSPTENEAFLLLHKTIKKIYPDAVVAPSLMLGTSDAQHYRCLSENIYRFLPIQLKSEDLKMIHGSNEKISIENYKRSINFYYHLLKNI